MVCILLEGTIANKFTQAINATYGSNLKAVDLGNYRIFQNHFNLKLFNKSKTTSRKASGFAFKILISTGLCF
jgi:hypothetical protein